MKDLRKAGNLSEVIFWQTFKDKQKLGFDIDRQVIIGNYIVDFFIPELGLVFEIDGSSHDDRVEYDAERDSFVARVGFRKIGDFVVVVEHLEKLYHIVNYKTCPKPYFCHYREGGNSDFYVLFLDSHLR